MTRFLAALILEGNGESLDRAYIETWLADLGVRELWSRIGVSTP